MAVISVVMCTVGKARSAADCVASVLAQTLADGMSLEIVVVDNSASGIAQHWVEAAAAAGDPVRYVHEPRPGISHARNAGVAEAKGEFLAFIDDDEVAEPDWLSNLFRALEAHSADIATGPVVPVFEGMDRLGFDPAPFFFGEREAMETGATLEAARTGNVLFRVGRCLSEPEPFNPKLGRSGGEDTDLTYRLHLKGRKIIWVADAVVHEYWPQEKASLPAFLRRKCVTARNTTFVRISHAARPGKVVLRTVAKALLQLAIFLPLSLVLYPVNRQRFAAAGLHVMSAVGKLTFWMRARYYGDAPEVAEPRAAEPEAAE
ncbi:glycosyltransferase [Stappia sp. GBMRC 2046]|uniref:Glycosyltransferase n=1 Tax=Stappia sediminis TaxID=2692190 RepID=A0A7X3LWY6_9HYPH|nr:glycosyltransferase family 2 protein [Stappia sediminis]MXN66627.1 glycosyltransferase [Stappia sediminis]